MTTIAPYVYDEIASENSIRVFYLHAGSKHDPIRGHLRQIELTDQTVEYSTLSYTWGSPQDPHFHIHVDGKSFEVRENLLHALNVLRHLHEEVALWIDAICINQDKIYEKNRQVAMMAKIYQSANRTRIWIGQSTMSSALAFEYLNLLCFQNDRYEIDPTPQQVDGLKAIFTRPYWYRAWILQEVLLSSTLDIHCGLATLTWDNLSLASEMLRPRLPDHLIGGPAFHLIRQRRALDCGQYNPSERTLESLIYAFASARATDPRDKVFALLQLACDCTSGSSLLADYGMPRFRLLIKVLQFCRPKDTLQFVTILMDALFKHNDDETWSQARLTWALQARTAVTSNIMMRLGSRMKRTYKISITYYVTLETSSGDSVRALQPSVEALVDLDFMQSTNSDLCNMVLTRANCNQLDFASSVRNIDDQNMVLVVDPTRLAIFSNSELHATVNPCRALGLHSNPDTCTRYTCSLSWRIVRFSAG